MGGSETLLRFGTLRQLRGRNHCKHDRGLLVKHSSQLVHCKLCNTVVHCNATGVCSACTYASHGVHTTLSNA